MRNLSVIFILVILCVTTACNKRPKYVLSDSEMESLMTDLILADAYERSASSQKLPDSIRNTLSDAVLAAHGVDQQTLDSTFAWYSRNLDDYYRLYARVDKRLAKMNKEAGGKSLDDSNLNDIWQLPKSLQFSPVSATDAFVFEMPGEAITKGDKLEWYFRINSDVKADVALGIDYTNGATALSRREMQTSKNISLSLIADTTLTPKRIFGLVRFRRQDMPVWLDSIRLTKTPFDSTSYESFRVPRFLMPPKRRKSVATFYDDANSSVSSGAYTSPAVQSSSMSSPPPPTNPPPPPPPKMQSVKSATSSRPGK